MNDLQKVIDPADEVGHKNRYINVLQHIALKDALGDTTDRLCLDVGCGIQRFKDLFPQYIGVDSNESMPSDWTCECNDLPFEDGTFDIVLSVWMLQYQEDLLSCVDEIRRVLAPGGMFVMIEQISKTGYHTVLPRTIWDYRFAFGRTYRDPLFGKPPERCIPILKEGDLLVGIVRRGLVPERLFPILARLHLMLIKYTREGVYTDYLMVFRK